MSSLFCLLLHPVFRQFCQHLMNFDCLGGQIAAGANGLTKEVPDYVIERYVEEQRQHKDQAGPN